MSDNLNLWNRAYKTAHSAVKPITGKQYKGNSPKPYWIVQRLTEELGPCGIGWGMVIVQERFERLTDTDVLHVATVRLWYELDGKRGELEQMGQTKACYKTSSGAMMVDEDAPKKSVTDALVKCASYLGFAGDIFSGRWDDSKYVRERIEDERKPADPPVEKLTADNIKWIKDACAICGKTPENIANAYKVAKIEDVPAKAFGAIKLRLEDAIKATQGEQK